MTRTVCKNSINNISVLTWSISQYKIIFWLKDQGELVTSEEHMGIFMINDCLIKFKTSFIVVSLIWVKWAVNLFFFNNKIKSFLVVVLWFHKLFSILYFDFLLTNYDSAFVYNAEHYKLWKKFLAMKKILSSQVWQSWSFLK